MVQRKFGPDRNEGCAGKAWDDHKITKVEDGKKDGKKRWKDCGLTLKQGRRLNSAHQAKFACKLFRESAHDGEYANEAEVNTELARRKKGAAGGVQGGNGLCVNGQ